MGADLFRDRDEWLTRLDEAIADFRDEGLRAADRNREYRRLAASKMLSLRSQGMPVGMCETVLKGDEGVSAAKYEAECAEVLAKAAQESINAAKRHLDVLREDIEREWRG